MGFIEKSRKFLDSHEWIHKFHQLSFSPQVGEVLKIFVKIFQFKLKLFISFASQKIGHL